MTTLKSMHTLLVEYEMLVDLKAHTNTRSSTLQTLTHELTQVNITVIAICTFPTYVKITPIHIIIKMC